MKNKYTTIAIVIITILLAGVAIFTSIRLYQTKNTAVAPNVPSSKPKAAGETCGGINGATCPSGEECIYSNGSKIAPSADATGTCTVITNKATATENTCSLSFTLVASSPTPTPTATPTPVPQCNATCSTSSDCPSNLACYIPSGATAGNCRNTQCNTISSCLCSTPTPTPTATPTVTATPTANPQCNNSCTSNSNCPSGLMCYIPSGATAGNCRNTQCLSESDCLCSTSTATPTTRPSLPDAGTTWPTIFAAGFGVLVVIGSLLLAL